VKRDFQPLQYRHTGHHRSGKPTGVDAMNASLCHNCRLTPRKKTSRRLKQDLQHNGGPTRRRESNELPCREILVRSLRAQGAEFNVKWGRAIPVLKDSSSVNKVDASALLGNDPKFSPKMRSGWAKKVAYGEAGWLEFEGIEVGVGKMWLENL
jgi:hypothetical protein